MNFKSLAVIVGESAREYVARTKGLASALKYHGIEVPDDEI